MDELDLLDAWWASVRDRVEAGEMIPIGRNLRATPEAMRDAYNRKREEIARGPATAVEFPDGIIAKPFRSPASISFVSSDDADASAWRAPEECSAGEMDVPAVVA